MAKPRIKTVRQLVHQACERLIELLGDESSVLQLHATKALEHLSPSVGTRRMRRYVAGRLMGAADTKARMSVLRGVVELDTAMDCPEIRALLVKLLDDEDHEAAATALLALACFNPDVATPVYRAKLLRLLEDDLPLVRALAVDAVGCLGREAEFVEAWERLGDMITDVDPQVQKWAAKSARAIRADAVPDLAARLLELLADDDASRRKFAANAVAELGADAATEAVSARLAGLLADTDEEVREQAAETLAEVGLDAITSDDWDRLLVLAKHSDPGIRESVASALAGSWSVPMTARLGKCLVDLLSDDNYRVRSHAADAIAELDPAAVSPEIRARLVELLQDVEGEEYFRVCESAARTLGELGPTVASAEIRAHLFALLHDERAEVRLAAAMAFRALGRSAITPAVERRLMQMLRDEAPVAQIAAEAIASQKKVEPYVLALLKNHDPDVHGLAFVLGLRATPAIRACLLDLLSDANPSIRSYGVGVMRRFGAKVFAPPIRERLDQLVRDDDSTVRAAAAEALGSLTRSQADCNAWANLLQLLDDEVPRVRVAAAYALRRIGSPAR